MELRNVNHRDERGQAVVEYILLVALVVMAFTIVAGGMERFKVGEALLKPIREDFARAYKYGHPKTTGFDEGSPSRHPRVTGGENNFRIFINPQ
ncbi:MAG: hypothetical protein A2X94_16785 [Bdellovibrionales bacterium GWB1_55_8]|nr:MAG: hypothetical protein A2X94_16785 [Bdellovibrionales bacterium GWB1_55_8]